MMDLLGWYPKGSRYTLLCLTGAGGQFFDLVEARVVENCLFFYYLMRSKVCQNDL